MGTRANNGHDRRDERDEAEERTEPPLSLAWLPPDHRRAVREAIDVLLDGLLDDLADYPTALAEVGETWLARWLPAAYLPRYDQRLPGASSCARRRSPGSWASRTGRGWRASPRRSRCGRSSRRRR